MNKVILVGRLTKDPEVRYTNNGDPIARFTVAVDRRGKKEGNEQNADFPNCVAFGKTADLIEKYFGKGRRIGLEGRIQTGSYTNKEGQKVYTTDVIVESVEFVESKGASTSTRQAPAAGPADADGFMNIPDGVDDESLPFN